MSQTSELKHRLKQQATGWKLGSIYQSESGEHFKIQSLTKSDGLRTIIPTKELVDVVTHFFDDMGHDLCGINCKHGDLIKLIDQNTTTYKIKGNG